MLDPRSIQLPIQKITGPHSAAATDHLAVEEPLEIRLALAPTNPAAPRTIKPISITMRTPPSPQNPDEDFELALGFLFSEGILRSLDDVDHYHYCGPETATLHLRNAVNIALRPSAHLLDLARLDRHFYTTSSCGVCGKTSLDALQTLRPSPITDNLTIPPDILHALPERLRTQQETFQTTGGLHAAALFDPAGNLLALREDVGRHNALDKLIGSQFLANALPLSNRILLLSGRASFELLQKSLMAGIPIVASVGAPSSLAAQLAQQFHITLIGFLRNHRFNIYSAPHRIKPAMASPDGGALADKTPE